MLPHGLAKRDILPPGLEDHAEKTGGLPPGLANKIPDLDVFASNSPNLILFNDGIGHFSADDAPGDAGSIALGDLDGDGDLDVIGPNQILINDGSGGFTVTDGPGGSAFAPIALGDLNGDGYIDAFVAHYGEYNQILINDGNGNLSADNAVGGVRGSVDVAIGDLNGDGHLDVFVANASQANQILFSDFSDGYGGFTATDAPGNISGFSSIAIGDLDGDGDLDVFVSSYGLYPGTQVLINNGYGNFYAYDAVGISTYGNSDIALGDLDGDGDLDVFVAVNDSYNSNRLFFNDGDGIHFTVGFAPYTGSFGSFTNAVALGDLDGDGDLDVLAVGFYTDILTNDGDGNFTAAAVDETDSVFLFDAALGDLDGDGGIPPVNDAGLPNLDTDDLLPSMYADTVIA